MSNIECGACGQIGHNKRNQLCISSVIKRNLLKMDTFTHTYPYYIESLKYIIMNNPGKICVVKQQISWVNGKLHGIENLSIISKCKLRYVYIKFNITDGNTSHANSLIVDQKNRSITRYEPHGIFNPYPFLDNELTLHVAMIGYNYIQPIDYCFAVGMQSAAEDTRGMCQTVVLYNLMVSLDPNSGSYREGIYKNTTVAASELKRVVVIFLTNIYFKLPINLRDVFLDYNNASIFAKGTIRNHL